MVVFDNKSSSRNNGAFSNQNNSNENDRGAAFLVRILQYLETPQYLRKALFAKHNSLRYVVNINFFLTSSHSFDEIISVVGFPLMEMNLKLIFTFLCLL